MGAPQVAVVGSQVSLSYDGSRDSYAGQLEEFWKQREGQAKVYERKNEKTRSLRKS